MRAYSLLVRYLLLSMYAARVLTTERERKRKRDPLLQGLDLEDAGETVQKNCEARAALTITMHKILYARIHLSSKKKKLCSYWHFKRFFKIPHQKKFFLFYKNLYLLICVEYL